MGANIGVVVRRGEFWHSVLSPIGTEDYGYALCATLHLFTEPLAERGVRSLEAFVWHDPTELQTWIAGLEAQGQDVTRHRQFLTQVQTQTDWYSPTDGMLSVQMALDILQVVMEHRDATNAFTTLERHLLELKTDLEAIATILHQAEAENAQFRFQIFEGSVL